LRKCGKSQFDAAPPERTVRQPANVSPVVIQTHPGALPVVKDAYKVLLQDWFRTSQAQKQVRGEIERVLGQYSLDTHDRAVFKQRLHDARPPWRSNRPGHPRCKSSSIGETWAVSGIV